RPIFPTAAHARWPKWSRARIRTRKKSTRPPITHPSRATSRTISSHFCTRSDRKGDPMKRIMLSLGFALLASACAKQTPPPATPPPPSGEQPQQNPEQSQPEQGQQNPQPGGGW